MKFRVLAGRYYKGKKMYEKGSTVESDRDLVKVFGKEKFEPIIEPLQLEPSDVKNKSSPPSSKTGGAEVITSIPPSSAPPDLLNIDYTSFGKDVTKNYINATRGGVRVFLKDDTYSIVDAGDGSIHNSKPLTSEKKVLRFLERLLE
jgi:hypothetical protein